MIAFESLFKDETRLGTKIKTDDYLEHGKHPIVDQGQNEVAGYTNLEDGIYTDVPAVIFGDHTRVIKYIDEPFFLGADGTKILKGYKPHSNQKYLYYALRAAKIPNLGYSRHFKYLKELKFVEHSEDEQQQIVAELDKLSEIISLKTKELSLYDELIKARFVEMFSESRCGTKKLNEITDIITKGTTPTTAGFEFTDSGINFFKIESITEDHTINLNKVAHVSEECHKALRRSQLREGDILFSIAGAIGRTAIISKGDLPGNTNQALAIIRLSNDSGISQKYLISALDSPEVFEQCRTKKRGVAQINLSLQDVGNIEIPIPSPMKQKTFELFAKQVDKSKFAVQKSLEKTQQLFDSLMQEYFS